MKGRDRTTESVPYRTIVAISAAYAIFLKAFNASTYIILAFLDKFTATGPARINDKDSIVTLGLENPTLAGILDRLGVADMKFPGM